MKMVAHVTARKKCKSNKTTGDTAEYDCTGDDDDEIAGDEDDEREIIRRSACNVSIGNRDLGNIVNSYPGDSLAL